MSNVAICESKVDDLVEGPAIKKYDVGSIFRQYHPKLRNFLLGRYGDVNLADDVAAHTFLKVVEHIEDKFDGENIEGWVYRIAHNTAKNYIRNKDNRYNGVNWVDELPAAPLTANPESVLMENEDRLGHLIKCHEVKGMFTKLVEKYVHPKMRETVCLREIHQYSYTEIAEKTGVAKGTVMSRLNRARKSLQPHMEGSFANYENKSFM